jgi:hypothetical protein
MLHPLYVNKINQQQQSLFVKLKKAIESCKSIAKVERIVTEEHLSWKSWHGYTYWKPEWEKEIRNGTLYRQRRRYDKDECSERPIINEVVDYFTIHDLGFTRSIANNDLRDQPGSFRGIYIRIPTGRYKSIGDWVW